MRRLSHLNALQAFRFAGELGSFKAAAEQLHVTQAAISQQIKSLEEQLDVKLFHRQTREVVLTAQGRQLLAIASSGFSTLEKSLDLFAQDPNPNQLTLSCLPSFASRWLVPRLGAFQRAHPDLQVRLNLSMKMDKFDQQSTDVAVRFGHGHYVNLQAIKLLEEHLIPVCHPSLIKSGQDLVPQLQKLSLLTDDSLDLASTWQDLEDKTGISFTKQPVRLRAVDANMLVDAVLSAQGLALLRFSLVEELLAKRQLVSPIRVSLKSLFDCYLVAPETHFKRSKIQKFEQWIKGEFEATQHAWVRFQKRRSGRSIAQLQVR
ncbi:MAG: LysR substrate-binding domain-containing protein [Limnobacter sp.]|nr:LysR substrate-binding domain-containing protein [Limnobacter sp.]